MFTFDQIKDLIQLVADRSLSGLEIERSGFRLKIDGRREAEVVLREMPAAGSAAPQVVVPRSEPAVAAPAAAAATAPAASVDDRHRVTSPIVGTFYTAPSPDADPFVRVGDRVKKGQVLCIVEAMKLMNEIESDVDGTVVEVFPRNAQPVEYGEPLFAIRLG